MTQVPMPSAAGAVVPAAEDASPPASAMLAVIARAAADPNVDVGKMRELLTMQRELLADQARSQFAEAFARLSGRLPRIPRRGEVRHPIVRGDVSGPTRRVSTYARLEDIDSAIRDLLREEGFALTFATEQRTGDGGGLIVTATLMHRGGHSQSASIPVPLDTSGSKNNIQGYGSALSYGRRYAMCAVLNIVTEGEDDDAQSADRPPPAPDAIDDEQVAEINRLIRETRSDGARVLAYAGAASVPAMTPAQYAKTRAMLLRKRHEIARGRAADA